MMKKILYWSGVVMVILGTDGDLQGWLLRLGIFALIWSLECKEIKPSK